jgi:hypothetical protein
MKYSTAFVVLLPVGIIASPAVEIRQPPPRAKFTGVFSASSGCGAATVTFDAANEVANVSLPNYRISLPGQNQRSCSITLPVLFPANTCTTGTAVGVATGQVTLPAGVQATFNGRDYAVSPTPGSVTQISPDGSWTGPVNERYELDDQVGYTFRPDANNDVINFTVLGQLQLQPSNGPSGSISNDRFVFDITRQIPCCEFGTNFGRGCYQLTRSTEISPGTEESRITGLRTKQQDRRRTSRRAHPD